MDLISVSPPIWPKTDMCIAISEPKGCVGSYSSCFLPVMGRAGRLWDDVDWLIEQSSCLSRLKLRIWRGCSWERWTSPWRGKDWYIEGSCWTVAKLSKILVGGSFTCSPILICMRRWIVVGIIVNDVTRKLLERFSLIQCKDAVRANWFRNRLQSWFLVLRFVSCRCWGWLHSSCCWKACRCSYTQPATTPTRLTAHLITTRMFQQAYPSTCHHQIVHDA